MVEDLDTYREMNARIAEAKQNDSYNKLKLQAEKNAQKRLDKREKIKKKVYTTASKIFRPIQIRQVDNRRARQIAAQRAKLMQKQMLTGEQAYLRDQLMQQQKMQKKQIEMNIQQAKFAKYYDEDDNERTEVDKQGIVYQNKFNQHLLRAKAHFDAVERKRRFNERPRDWEARRDAMRNFEIQRIRDAVKRTNLMRAHIDGPKAPKLFQHDPDSPDSILQAPNLFSRNNPRNQNVFDERGRTNILQTPNVFKVDVSEFNPLNAENLFGGRSNQQPINKRRLKFRQE